MAKHPTPPAATAQPVVLIVDDSVTNLHVLNGALRGHFQVKAAKDGAKALRLAAQARPDLILLDVMMPEMDGPEVCRRLKADPATAHIPVVFLSGSDSPDEVASCLDAGGAEHLLKPIEPATLRERLRAHLSASATLR
jgi:CheY-like chemotaxis protein